MLVKIFKDPGLYRDDLANLRLVCKRFSTYATEAFARECFSGSLRFEPSNDEFARLAAICSSGLQHFLKFVHFVHDTKCQSTQTNTRAGPNYSAIRTIKLGTPLYDMRHTRNLEKVLQRADRLENFMFSPVMIWYGIHWIRKHGMSAVFTNNFGHVRDRDVNKIEKANIILSSIRSDCLSKLFLSDSILPSATLKGLLERHSGTIRKLSLCNCQLVDGKWLNLLQWIPHGLSCLEHLQCLQETKVVHPHHSHPQSAVMWRARVTKSGKKNIDTYMTSLKKGDDF